MSNKAREALEKFSAVDLSGLKFPLDGDSSTIYNSDKKEITIPYWRVAELLNGVKAAQDMAKSVLAAPLRNCDAFSKAEVLEVLEDRSFSKEDTVEWLYAAKGESDGSK